MQQLVLDTRATKHLLGHMRTCSSSQEANCVFVEAEIPSQNPQRPYQILIFVFALMPIREGVPLQALAASPSCQRLTTSLAEQISLKTAQAVESLQQQLDAADAEQVGCFPLQKSCLRIHI